MDGIAEARAIGCYKGAVQDGVADHLAVSRRTCEQEKPKVGMFGPHILPRTNHCPPMLSTSDHLDSEEVTHGGLNLSSWALSSPFS